MVDHATLAAAYASAGFILYPTTFPETGCVTLMKAMAHGCVPITSRYKHSTLPELTEPFDLGPRPLSPDHERDGDWGPWVALWEESVVAASLRAQEGDNLRAHRDAMVAAARSRFPWSSVAKLWHESFEG